MTALVRARRAPGHPAPPAPDPARQAVQLAPEADPAATRLWLDHVAAGRIGAPPPPLGAGEHRLASLAAILGPRRARIW